MPLPLHRDPAPPAPASVRVVGLGASAGGLAPLEAFLAAVPPDSGLAFVVVQHMDPTRKALLTELLRRCTAMPVTEATDGLRLQPDQVFVIPPGQDLTVTGGHLRLNPPTQPRGLRLPIDHLFASLAADGGARSIGVVLSGMGSDGTLGLQAIHEAGGLTLVQSPETARYPAMPQNALAHAGVDIVAAAGELLARLLAALGEPAGTGSAAPPDPAASLDAILQRLREHTRHDLSDYKPSTLRRRIDRRLAVHGLSSLAAYADLVRRNPSELDLLFQEVLIGVTQFFRDPEVWDELRDQVMPALLDRVPPGQLLRAWVAGCSTGEEAYTLAMVHAEAADAFTQRTGRPAPLLQVFASDLSPTAITVARRGQYGPRVAEEVGPQRLQRFFRPAGDGYRVAPSLRDRVLFARHDVILDPPFTRLDLLSCRNLLIYFNAALQRRLLPLFGYSLRPGGVLLLGSSETVGPAQNLFTPINPRSRLYWRSSHTQSAGAVDFPVSPRPADPTHTEDLPLSASSPSSTSLQTLAEQALLQAFAPAAVLVNEQGDVLYVHGSVGAYLEPAAGKANWNIHVMARPGIRTPVAVALRQARVESRAVQLPDLPLDPGGADTAVGVTVAPAPQAGLFIVAFRPALPLSPDRPVAAGRDATDEALRAELLCCKDEMAALRREMLASAEELQAANEALQSTNEELQSANEELTTSKEESQSMNEELQTLNQELQTKLDDLALAHSDMQNLLNSTDIATLFLDNDLQVRRFTEPVTRLIHLRESDIGRPLSDLATTLNYPELDADARQTLRTLTFTEKEITTSDGHWYMVRIKPYRTLADLIQGVVITFIDITAAKELESRLRQG
ncbi:chemotaxis protein CheB [Hydrogenophaga sp. IBVHS2]|uniref:chemotaxis protein CheB n=1 Tax=Hydrogenophaga sp. IBVHS2 TaxID=1985170 RepID=UPI000A2EB7C2|nr:chemotaxis protein CheB [Hydrogenophaga sp. IBVHS2]OSZ65811.1 chemotaxis protein CheB [Hydrogenophaga sp. IBVHS2]